MIITSEADWTDSLEVICADIGSIPKGNFAWARRLSPAPSESEHQADSIDGMATAIIDCLQRGVAVAVGFEMPLFLPVPEMPTSLGKARPTDIDAPAWSSSTGASVMATGIVQASWVLRRVFEEVPNSPVTLSWETFAERQEGLLVWEAFVTRTAKGITHEDDAKIGLEAFCLGLPNPGDARAMAIPRPFSLAAMVCAWAGWPLPAEALRQIGVVARARGKS